ncbi:MAG: AAA family ATPase [Candidatus Nitrohelix vancouverensis]|uniref:AAA family ATPase n=1 Tax=Candidatus Nitrohelix vancouverensis TaxID=2705534 RepID=A0A7T0C261_9BACT|nr:MAG: AAA family ATPase [Candidatus Nitrohelix vancouverensis]
MYEDFYRFKEKPFSLTPDPEFLYLSKQHQGALDHMMYGIRQREGFMAVVGDVGTGKTTLSRCLLEQLDPGIAVALILNPMLSDMDLLKTCIHDLGAPPVPSRRSMAASGASLGDPGFALEMDDSGTDEDWVNSASKKELLDALNHFLIEQSQKGGSTVIIIDEAQNLPLQVMEQLRILSNLETEKEKLLQIIFVGQLELNDKLFLPELKQLNQRISIRYEITPLSKEETRNYINHRLLVAGVGSRVAFAAPAVNLIYNFSKGYPRLINLACDRTLLAGYNSQADVLQLEHARQGIRSLQGKDDRESRTPLRAFSLKKTLALAAALAVAGFLIWNETADAPNAENSVAVQAAQPTPVSAPAPRVAPEPTPQTIAEPVPAEAPQSEAVAVPVVEPEPNVAAPEEAGYRIHVDSTNSKKEADNEVARLQQAGFDAFSKQVQGPGGAWYMIYVGPFEDAANARVHMKALKFAGKKPILLSIINNG